jgi:hypothetical protein
MSTFAELWDATPVAPDKLVNVPKVTPQEQSGRDADRQRILTQELANERALLANATSPAAGRRAQSNIDSITREMGGKVTPTVETFADLWESTPAAGTVKTEDLTTEKPKSNVANIARQTVSKTDYSNRTPEVLRTPDFLYEVPRAVIQNTAAQIAGGYAGIVGSLLPGPAGQGAQWSEKVQQMLGNYEPPSAGGKVAMKVLGAPGEYVISPVAEAAGSAVANVSPAAGAIVKGTIEALPFALGLIKGKAKPAGVTKEVVPGSEIPPLDVPTVIRQQFEAKRGEAPATRGTQTFPEMQAALEKKRLEALGVKPTAVPAETVATEMAGMGAAMTDTNPFPSVAGQETSRGNYPVVKLTKIADAVPITEQSLRSTVASEILGPDKPIRTGVVNGSENTLRTEYTEARLPEQTQRGRLLKEQMADEQTALSQYAENIRNETNAQRNATDYARGERVNSALATDEGLTGLFKTEKNAIYKEAEKTVGNKPVASTEFESLIASPSFQAELKLAKQSDFTGGLKQLLDIHKDTGLPLGKDKFAAPNSIAGLEALRKTLNKQWNHENKYFIGRAVEAIDNDIAKSGGAGLYEKAINLHAFEKTIMGSKAMESLFGDVGPNGIKKGAAAEQVMQKLNNLSLDEWQHVYNTLNDVASGEIRFKGNVLAIPEELRITAESARNEMQGSLVNEIYKAGSGNKGEWNANAANKAMNKLDAKIQYSLPPDLQRKLHTLNLGGQWMPGIQSYEGAALQTQRVGKIEKSLPAMGASAGAAAGGAIGGPGGAAVGAYLMEKAGSAGQKIMSARRETKEAKKLAQEMKANIPTKLKDIGKKD